jgi:hypothetical protein
MPGDWDDNTHICAGAKSDGWASGYETYHSISVLPANYAQYDFNNSGKINECILFWAELYEKKHFNFQPIKELAGFKLPINKTANYINIFTNHQRPKYKKNNPINQIKAGYYFIIFMDNKKPRAEAFDAKLDDGNPLTGDIFYNWVSGYYQNGGVGSIYWKFFDYK